ncbi:MAG: PCRF domain-containing protein [Patescibacteria group bacterium]|nr:PCRF domain-containing protein [Patescibacteria group bacterium]
MNPNTVTLEIRPGPGGEEAKLWANDLLRMYSKYALSQSWKIIPIDEGVIKVSGLNAFPAFAHEAGVHRVQRVPVTEKRGRIHTSTASVAVLGEVPEQEVTIRPEDLEIQFYRASSHGGQNVQKVSTAVRLRHIPTNIVVTAQSERFQEQNRANALSILRSKLWEIEEDKRIKALGDQRAIIGRAMRNEKIRTYNFTQDRITDHRINKSFHNIEDILDGKMDKIIEEMKKLA